MYGIGIFEIFIIFLVLLLFVKPEEIFSLFRKAGAWYSRIRDFEREIREDQNESFGFDTENPDGADEEENNL
jgi:Sec-independent protein translocase protein TatA